MPFVSGGMIAFLSGALGVLSSNFVSSQVASSLLRNDSWQHKQIQSYKSQAFCWVKVETQASS